VLLPFDLQTFFRNVSYERLLHLHDKLSTHRGPNFLNFRSNLELGRSTLFVISYVLPFCPLDEFFLLPLYYFYFIYYFEIIFFDIIIA
jgi:hypothetical protein